MTELPHRRAETFAVLVSCAAASTAAVVWSWQHDAMLNYGDAVAHLAIARRVIDSHYPGLKQLGSVWLPLPHLLMIPFVAIYRWWADGIAGMIPSALPSYCSCDGNAVHSDRPREPRRARAYRRVDPTVSIPNSARLPSSRAPLEPARDGALPLPDTLEMRMGRRRTSPNTFRSFEPFSPCHRISLSHERGAVHGGCAGRRCDVRGSGRAIAASTQIEELRFWRRRRCSSPGCDRSPSPERRERRTRLAPAGSRS